MIWQEPFVNGARVDDSTIVHVWKDDGPEVVKDATDRGLRAVVSSGFYLDRMRPNINKRHDQWVSTFNDFYQNDFAETVDEDKLHLLLGGEMW